MKFFLQCVNVEDDNACCLPSQINLSFLSRYPNNGECGYKIKWKDHALFWELIDRTPRVLTLPVAELLIPVGHALADERVDALRG